MAELKFTKTTLHKIEQIFQEQDYTIRYEKGNFQSGYCIVESKKISDEEAILLSRDVVRKIEESLTFPGQIKVTVIRETRAVEYANK